MLDDVEDVLRTSLHRIFKPEQHVRWMRSYIRGLLALGFCATVFLNASERTLSQVAGPARTLASSGLVSNEQTLQGRIASIDGPFRMIVSDDDGCIDRVTLRPGTIITPKGLTLSVSMRVTIRGHKVGDAFEATAIRTHYVYYPHSSTAAPNRRACR
jgi:hypothetical protein